MRELSRGGGDWPKTRWICFLESVQYLREKKPQVSRMSPHEVVRLGCWLKSVSASGNAKIRDRQEEITDHFTLWVEVSSALPEASQASDDTPTRRLQDIVDWEGEGSCFRRVLFPCIWCISAIRSPACQIGHTQKREEEEHRSARFPPVEVLVHFPRQLGARWFYVSFGWQFARLEHTALVRLAETSCACEGEAHDGN